MFTFLTHFLKELFDKKKDIKNRNVYKRDTLFTVKNAKLVLKPQYLFYLSYRKLNYALCSKLDIYAFC